MEKSFSNFITERDMDKRIHGQRIQLIKKVGKVTLHSIGEYLKFSGQDGNIKVHKDDLVDLQTLIGMAKKAMK